MEHASDDDAEDVQHAAEELEVYCGLDGFSSAVTCLSGRIAFFGFGSFTC